MLGAGSTPTDNGRPTGPRETGPGRIRRPKKGGLWTERAPRVDRRYRHVQCLGSHLSQPGGGPGFRVSEDRRSQYRSAERFTWDLLHPEDRE